MQHGLQEHQPRGQGRLRPGDRADQRRQDAAAALATGAVKDTETGEKVPSVLATPVWITADKVQTVIDDGFAKASDICVDEFAKACKEHGIK